MADVVLVFPKSSYLEKAMRSFYLPLSLLNAAIYVEKEYSVKIIDQRTTPNWKKILLAELRQEPLCVGVSSATGEQISNALEVSRIVKENSSSKVVWGGSHANVLPEQTLQNEFIDIVLPGEGEISFYNLVKALDKQTPLKNVKGILFKENGKTKITPLEKQVDLNSLPRPPYHLVNIKDYILDFGNQKMFIMETSRGCPNRCTFCFVQQSLSQRKWRAITPEKTVEDIKYIQDRFKVDGVEFQDLTSFVHLKRLEDFSKLMIKEKVNMFWNTCARIDDIMKLDSQRMKLLEKSQLKRLALGVETGSARILKMIKKGITISQVLAASKKLSKTSIEPVYSFMAGFPTETPQELNMTSDLVMRLLRTDKLAKTTIVHCYRPFPGNELYDLSVKHGLKTPKNLEGWSKYTMDWIDHPWLTKKMQHNISSLNFLSLFLDKKYEEINDPFVRLFAKMYKPIAKYRVKNRNYNYMIEPYFKKLYIKLKE